MHMAIAGGKHTHRYSRPLAVAPPPQPPARRRTGRAPPPGLLQIAASWRPPCVLALLDEGRPAFMQKGARLGGQQRASGWRQLQAGGAGGWWAGASCGRRGCTNNMHMISVQ